MNQRLNLLNILGLCLLGSSLAAIENCKVPNAENPALCGQCDDSFGLNWNATACFKCADNCAACVEIMDMKNSVTKVQCSQCKAGSYRFQDSMILGYGWIYKCTLCDRNCANCVDTVGCNKCSEGYFKISFGNEEVGCQKNIEHCADLQDFKGCQKCIDNYYTYGGTEDESPLCFPCDPKCEDCKNRIGCSKCKTGYFTGLSNRGDTAGGFRCHECDPNCQNCVKTVGCSTCNPKFYLKSSSDNEFIKGCSPCQANCLSCSDMMGGLECTKCEDNYYAFGDSFSNLQENCLSCDPHCADCLDSTGCAKCQAGFFAVRTKQESGKTCKECDANCQECSDDLGCKACKPRFFLKASAEVNNTKICMACAANCASCSEGSSGVACQVCDAGFYTEGADCLPCPTEHCKTCTSTSCTDCLSGFELTTADGQRLCSVTKKSSGLSYMAIVLIVIGIFIAGLTGLFIRRYLLRKKTDAYKDAPHGEHSLSASRDETNDSLLK